MVDTGMTKRIPSADAISPPFQATRARSSPAWKSKSRVLAAVWVAERK